MPGLDDDSSVLLSVISYLDVPSILKLRQTCKSMNKLISRHEFSIAQAATRSAWHSNTATDP